MDGKVCSRCKEWKDADAFYPRRERNSLSPRCKACCAEIHRERYQKDPEKFRSRGRELYAENPERVKIRKREWRSTMSEEQKQQAVLVTKEWRKKNPERVKAWKKRHYESHKEVVNAKSCQWQREHAEERKVYMAAYFQANREKIKAQANDYNQRNREECNARSRKWRRENRDKVRTMMHKQRARRSAVEGSFTLAEWQELCEKYGNRCLRCGHIGRLCQDHIISLRSVGATNTIDNIQPLCKSCNSTKNAKTIDYRPDRSSLLINFGAVPYLPTEAGVRNQENG